MLTWLSSGMYRCVVLENFIKVLVYLAAGFIILFMEAAGASETLVKVYQTTQRYNPCLLMLCGYIIKVERPMSGFGEANICHLHPTDAPI